MDKEASEAMIRIWQQRSVPVIVRRGEGYPVHVKLPNPMLDPSWLASARKLLKPTTRSARPVWLQKSMGFEVPKGWFSGLVNRLRDEFGQVYVVQPYRVQEKCSPSCMNAIHHVCECSCMGKNHGAGGPGKGWFVVSEAFATQWGEQQLACRLMIKAS